MHPKTIQNQDGNAEQLSKPRKYDDESAEPPNEPTKSTTNVPAKSSHEQLRLVPILNFLVEDLGLLLTV